MSEPDRHEDAVITMALHVCEAISVTTGHWLLTCLLWLSAAMRERHRHCGVEEEIKEQMAGAWRAI